MNDPLFLSSRDISAIVRRTGIDAYMDALIERLEAALRDYNEASCKVPARDGFQYETPFTGLVEWMPLMRSGESVMMKLVGYHPDNPAVHDLPTILSSLSLFDVRTGKLQALADGTFLTCLRTGAASAVASKLMAKPDSATLGLIGAGAQAVSQLHALSRVFPLQQVLVYDKDPAVAETFAQRVAPLQIDAISIQITELDQVVAQSDIICTATSVEKGSGPVFEGSIALQPGLHINAVGSDLPGKVEVPVAVLEKSFVCPDFLTQALVEGECQQLNPEDINIELHEIVKNPTDFVMQQNQLSVFDSTGFALEDQVALEHAIEQARALGIGVSLNLEHTPDDPYNPYETVFEAIETNKELTRIISA